MQKARSVGTATALFGILLAVPVRFVQLHSVSLKFVPSVTLHWYNIMGLSSRFCTYAAVSITTRSGQLVEVKSKMLSSFYLGLLYLLPSPTPFLFTRWSLTRDSTHPIIISSSYMSSPVPFRWLEQYMISIRLCFQLMLYCSQSQSCRYCKVTTNHFVKPLSDIFYIRRR